MGLAKVLWCDFVTYTYKNFTVERITFNKDFWDTMQETLTEFYFRYVLPKSCTHNKDGMEE